ncbi:MAG: hypothetical protein H7255_16050 [Ramlibacter sp.]|nr:hypothetical protein [Ramlibacter sp.]
MDPSIGALFFAFASFALTFVVARVLGKRFRERRAQRAADKAKKGQSRQVRRAQERQGK